MGGGWKGDGVLRGTTDGLNNKKVGFGREDYGADATLGGQKGALTEGFAAREICDGREGGKSVANAKEKTPVAETPKILAAVVETPLGAAEGMTRGKLDEDRLDVAVLIFRGLVGQALKEAMGAVGEKEMLAVDVVERVHGAAGEEELGRERLVAQWFQWDANGWVGIACGQKRNNGQQKKRKNTEVVAWPVQRGNESGNRHGCLRVSPHYCFTDAWRSPMDAGGVS